MAIKRKIFYIPGFDPRSESHYKKLLLKEFPEIKISLINKEKNKLEFSSTSVAIDYEILSWHKIVKCYWSDSFMANFINIVIIFYESLFKGAYYRLSKISPKSILQKPFLSYVALIWFFMSILMLILLNDLSVSFSRLETFIGWSVFFAVNIFIYKLLGKANFFWVAKVMRFYVSYAQNESKLVKNKELEFKQKIIAALDSQKYDEVVLVSHSVGTILCLSVYADLVKEKKDLGLTVVTLGHCVTGVQVIDGAKWYLDKLRVLSTRNSLWIDVTSGKDAVAFHRLNPGYYSCSAPNAHLPALFHRIFDKTFYQNLKWNFYEIHFLYLCKPCYPLESEFNYQKLIFDENIVVDLNKYRYHYSINNLISAED